MVTKKKRFSVSLNPDEVDFIVNLSQGLDKSVSETIGLMIQRTMQPDIPGGKIMVSSPDKVLNDYEELLEIEKRAQK